MWEVYYEPGQGLLQKLYQKYWFLKHVCPEISWNIHTNMQQQLELITFHHSFLHACVVGQVGTIATLGSSGKRTGLKYHLKSRVPMGRCCDSMVTLLLWHVVNARSILAQCLWVCRKILDLESLICSCARRLWAGLDCVWCVRSGGCILLRTCRPDPHQDTMKNMAGFSRQTLLCSDMIRHCRARECKSSNKSIWLKVAEEHV